MGAVAAFLPFRAAASDHSQNVVQIVVPQPAKTHCDKAETAANLKDCEPTTATVSGVLLQPGIVVAPFQAKLFDHKVTLKSGGASFEADATIVKSATLTLLVVSLPNESVLSLAPAALAKSDPKATLKVDVVTSITGGSQDKTGNVTVDPAGNHPPQIAVPGNIPGNGATLFNDCGDVVGIAFPGAGRVVLADELAGALGQAAARADICPRPVPPPTLAPQPKLDKAKKPVVTPPTPDVPTYLRAHPEIIMLGIAILAAIAALIVWLAMGPRKHKAVKPPWNDCLLEASAGPSLKLSGLRLANGGLVVGRSRQDADILLGKDDVTRRHAMFEASEAGAHVTDLGSLNGTFVNSVKLDKNEPKRLYDGDFVLLGENKFLFRVLPKR